MQQKQEQLQHGMGSGLTGQQQSPTGPSGLTGPAYEMYRQPYDKNPPYGTSMDSSNKQQQLPYIVTIDSRYKHQEFYPEYGGQGQMNEYENIYERPLPQTAQPI